MNCLYCNTKLSKGRRKFCCNKHKDRYHNFNNPRGYFSNKSEDDLTVSKIENDMHPLETDSLGQWDD